MGDTKQLRILGLNTCIGTITLTHTHAHRYIHAQTKHIYSSQHLTSLQFTGHVLFYPGAGQYKADSH